MLTQRQLEIRLSALSDFPDHQVDLEQYMTPPDIVAQLIHVAGLRGDIEGRPVVDLGAGTGIFAIGAALYGAESVIGLEVDPAALAVARVNQATADSPIHIDWILGEVFHLPLRPIPGATVVMNPPFGAQWGNRHADRRFLGVAQSLGAVSYSIHNAGSERFIESFANDHGATVTDAFELSMGLRMQFDFHTETERTIEAECFRIEWGRHDG